MRNAFASLKCSNKYQHNVQRPSARRQPYEAVHERIWNLCNNLFKMYYRTEWVVFERVRDTEQRIPCSSRLQPSTSRWVANSGDLRLLHHMRKSVTVARWNLLLFLGLNLRPRGPLASAVVI